MRSRECIRRAAGSRLACGSDRSREPTHGAGLDAAQAQCRPSHLARYRYSSEPCTQRNDCTSIMSRGRRSRRSSRTVAEKSSNRS